MTTSSLDAAPVDPADELQRLLGQGSGPALEILPWDAAPKKLAEHLAALVDQALGREAGTSPASETGAGAVEGEEREVTCSCGSGVPVTKLSMDGRFVELVALPLIFQQFRERGRGQDEAAARELFETVKIYNAVPPEAESSYREAVLREYAAYCQKEAKS